MRRLIDASPLVISTSRDATPRGSHSAGQEVMSRADAEFRGEQRPASSLLTHFTAMRVCAPAFGRFLRDDEARASSAPRYA